MLFCAHFFKRNKTGEAVREARIRLWWIKHYARSIRQDGSLIFQHRSSPACTTRAWCYAEVQVILCCINKIDLLTSFSPCVLIKKIRIATVHYQQGGDPTGHGRSPSRKKSVTLTYMRGPRYYVRNKILEGIVSNQWSEGIQISQALSVHIRYSISLASHVWEQAEYKYNPLASGMLAPPVVLVYAYTAGISVWPCMLKSVPVAPILVVPNKSKHLKAGNKLNREWSLPLS